MMMDVNYCLQLCLHHSRPSGWCHLTVARFRPMGLQLPSAMGRRDDGDWGRRDDDGDWGR